MNTTTYTRDHARKVDRLCYHSINISFGVIILGIILYSYIFHGNNHPIPALLTQLTGMIPPSKGLSAGFSEIVRGNFDAALIINPYCLRVFSFFIIQFFSRALVSISIEGNWIKTTHLVLIDTIFSITLFTICFAPLITFSLRLFAKLF